MYQSVKVVYTKSCGKTVQYVYTRNTYNKECDSTNPKDRERGESTETWIAANLYNIQTV